MSSDFDRDNDWQRGIRDTILAPQFYGRYALAGRYVFIDKGRLATRLQRQFAVDTIMQGRGGAAICIEEKIVRWPRRGVPYTAYSLETHSCTKPGHESDGWMRYGHADYLLYCFQRADGGLDCHLIDFPRLQAWFEPRESSFPIFGPLDTLNRSMGRVVPIADVAAGVPTSVWRLEAPMMIRDDEGHAQAVARIEALFDAKLGTPECDELDALTNEVIRYEDSRWPLEPLA